LPTEKLYSLGRHKMFKCWKCSSSDPELIGFIIVWNYFRWRILRFCVKLFPLKNFTLSLNEAPKAHYFCFLLLIQISTVQQKSNKATLPNNETFSTVKLALYVQSLCLSLHN